MLNQEFSGEGVVVYVVDSGTQADHIEFRRSPGRSNAVDIYADAILRGADPQFMPTAGSSLSPEAESEIANVFPFPENRVGFGYTSLMDHNAYEDCNGHGTHVSGTIAGANVGVA